MMKQTLAGILTAVLAVSLCAATAFAAGPRCGRYYVDADGDGVCDNIGSRCAYVDADGDGVCDVCGAEHGSCPAGRGMAFVDEDHDGVCDNCGVLHWCGMAGGSFVDADGDGICDNFQSGQGRGCGRGGQGGRGNGFRGGRNR